MCEVLAFDEVGVLLPGFPCGFPTLEAARAFMMDEFGELATAARFEIREDGRGTDKYDCGELRSFAYLGLEPN